MGAISKLFLAASAIVGVSSFSNVPGSSTGRSRHAGDENTLTTDQFNLNLMAQASAGRYQGWQRCLAPKYGINAKLKDQCLADGVAQNTGDDSTCSGIMAKKSADEGGAPLIRIGKDIGAGACKSQSKADEFGNPVCDVAFARYTKGFLSGIFDEIYTCYWDDASSKCKFESRFRNCFASAQAWTSSSSNTDEISFEEVMTTAAIDGPANGFNYNP